MQRNNTENARCGLKSGWLVLAASGFSFSSQSLGIFVLFRQLHTSNIITQSTSPLALRMQHPRSFVVEEVLGI